MLEWFVLIRNKLFKHSLVLAREPSNVENVHNYVSALLMSARTLPIILHGGFALHNGLLIITTFLVLH